MGQLTTWLDWGLEIEEKAEPQSFSPPPLTEVPVSVETALSCLNRKITLLAEERGKEAQQFFKQILSRRFVFRCANGKVIGKADYLKRLAKPSPFTDYSIEYVEESPAEKRALVTVIVRTQDQYAAVRYFRHIRLFTRTRIGWKLEFWYTYEDLCA
jgi:hypothetical protein